jgi:hypothetical protein
MGGVGERGPEVIPCDQAVHARDPSAVPGRAPLRILHIQGILEAGVGRGHSVGREEVIAEMIFEIVDRGRHPNYFHMCFELP